MTTRTASITNDGMILLGEKTDLELANKDLKKRGVYTSTQQQIKDLREFCATITNNALKDAKIDASVDHRSHKERNLKIVPTIKLGFKASSLERKGITTERGDINRAIRAYNDALNAPVPAPTPKPKPAPQPPKPAPVVHHAPTVTPQFIDDFARSFADELSNEYESFATAKTVAPAPPAPKPAEPPPPPPANNDSLDSKHSIQQSNKAQATEILRLPASFFYADTTVYGVKVMAEIGHYGRYAQGSESLGRVGIHEFDSRSLLRTTFDYDATNQKIVSIGGLGAYLRERIPNDAKQRENVENAMIDGLQKRAQFLQENNLDAYEQHIKSTLKTHFNVEQSATAERTAHQRNNDRDFDR